MKRNLVIGMVIFVLMLTSCQVVNKYGAYKDSKEYHVLCENGELYNDPISEINIDWISGKIIIQESSEYNGVTLLETSKNKDVEYMCYVWNQQKKLNVKYCASNVIIPMQLEKTLYVYIPQNYAIDQININNVSSSIHIDNVNLKDLNIENVSGNVQLNATSANHIYYDGVSGTLTCLLSQSTTHVQINQVSGNTILSFPQTHQGFKIDYDSVSGAFQNPDFLVTGVLGEYTYLDSNYLQIEVDSVSGNLMLLQNTNQDDPVDRTSEEISIQ